jgi:hypothetical protein
MLQGRTGSKRVLHCPVRDSTGRGGSFNNNQRNVRCAFRNGLAPTGQEQSEQQEQQQRVSDLRCSRLSAPAGNAGRR